MLSHVWLSVTPWTVACWTPLSTGIPRQEYWCGSPFLSPGHLLVPRIERTSPVTPALASGFFTTEPSGKPASAVCLRSKIWDSLDPRRSTQGGLFSPPTLPPITRRWTPRTFCQEDQSMLATGETCLLAFWQLVRWTRPSQWMEYKEPQFLRALRT